LKLFLVSGGYASAPTALSVGQKVSVEGLQSRPEVNGKEALVKVLAASRLA